MGGETAKTPWRRRDHRHPHERRDAQVLVILANSLREEDPLTWEKETPSPATPSRSRRQSLESGASRPRRRLRPGKRQIRQP